MILGRSIEEQKEIKECSEYALSLMDQALKNVDPAYVLLKYGDSGHVDKESDVYKQVERCFAYELYHQLRMLSAHSDILGKTIVVNAEVPKEYHSEEELTSNKRTYVFPDIVIHGGQVNKNYQLLVCEIKRNIRKTQLSEKDIKCVFRTKSVQSFR